MPKPRLWTGTSSNSSVIWVTQGHRHQGPNNEGINKDFTIEYPQPKVGGKNNWTTAVQNQMQTMEQDKQWSSNKCCLVTVTQNLMSAPYQAWEHPRCSTFSFNIMLPNEAFDAINFGNQWSQQIKENIFIDTNTGHQYNQWMPWSLMYI